MGPAFLVRLDAAFGPAVIITAPEPVPGAPDLTAWAIRGFAVVGIGAAIGAVSICLRMLGVL